MSKPEKAFVLRIAPSRIDRVPDALKHDYITIGWSRAGKILHEEDWRKFREIVHKSSYSQDKGYRRSGQAAGYLWQFLREMKPGHWVVVPHGNQFYVCEITGEPTYDARKVADDTAFRRAVRWLNGKKPIERWRASAALQSRMKIQGTSAYAEDLISAIDAVLRERGVTKKLTKESVFAHELHQKMVETALNTIRSGKLDSFGFERLLETLFKAEGGKVEIVPRRLDKGADLKVTFRFASIAQAVVGVQAKHFQPKPPVGAHVADQILAGVEAIEADFGMIITSGEMSPELESRVQEIYEKEGVRIQLVDGEQLAAWLVERGLSASA